MSKRSFDFACLIIPAGPELRHHSAGACRERGRGTFDVFLPTRLETRTKESNIYAIMLVFSKPNMSNESERCQPQGAASASCDPLEKRTGCERIC